MFVVFYSQWSNGSPPAKSGSPGSPSHKQDFQSSMMKPELKHLPLSTSEKNRKRSMILLSMQDKTHLWTIHLAIPSFHGLIVLRPVPFFISSRHHCPRTDSMAMTVRARMMVATRIKKKDSRDGNARYNACPYWYLNPFEKHFTKLWKFLVDWGAPFFS